MQVTQSNNLKINDKVVAIAFYKSTKHHGQHHPAIVIGVIKVILPVGTYVIKVEKWFTKKGDWDFKENVGALKANVFPYNHEVWQESISLQKVIEEQTSQIGMLERLRQGNWDNLVKGLMEAKA